MSYTVVISEEERERRFENRLNAVVRRCRIGAIRQKVAEVRLTPILIPRMSKDTFFVPPYEPNTTPLWPYEPTTPRWPHEIGTTGQPMPDRGHCIA